MKGTIGATVVYVTIQILLLIGGVTTGLALSGWFSIPFLVLALLVRAKGINDGEGEDGAAIQLGPFYSIRYYEPSAVPEGFIHE